MFSIRPVKHYDKLSPVHSVPQLAGAVEENRVKSEITTY